MIVETIALMISVIGSVKNTFSIGKKTGIKNIPKKYNPFLKKERLMAKLAIPIPVNPSTMVYCNAKGMIPNVYTLIAHTVKEIYVSFWVNIFTKYSGIICAAKNKIPVKNKQLNKTTNT